MQIELNFLHCNFTFTPLWVIGGLHQNRKRKDILCKIHIFAGSQNHISQILEIFQYRNLYKNFNVNINEDK